MSSLKGFSKLLGLDASKFVRLDDDASSGRNLFIYKPLALSFTGLSASELQVVLSRINQISATAGGMCAYSSTSDAMAHKQRIGNHSVSYKVFAETGDPTCPPGVYITDFSTANFSDGEPLPYKVKKDQGDWVVEKKQSSIRIDTPYAAINGLCDNHIQAAQDIMPEMVEKSWENRKWAKVVSDEPSQTGFTLMYNPPHMYDNGTQWKTPNQKKWTKQLAAERLAAQLDDLQRRNKDMLWTVHGDGAEMFRDALQHSKSQKLDKHTFMFCAPTIKMSEITSKANTKGFNIHDDVMKINSDDWNSRKVQAEDSYALKASLEELDGFKDKALEFFEEGQDDLYKLAGVMEGVFRTVKGVVSAPVDLPLTAIKYAAGGPGKVRSDIRKLKSLRNSAANSSTDHNINPHMHPFKNGIQTNIHMSRQKDVNKKSFKALLNRFVNRN